MQLVKAERIRRGWTQGFLAQRMGLTQTRISSMERHPQRVTLDHLFQLGEALNISFTAKPKDKRNGYTEI